MSKPGNNITTSYVLSSSNTLQGEEHVSGILTNVSINELEHTDFSLNIYIFYSASDKCYLPEFRASHKMFASSCLVHFWKVPLQP